MTSREPLAADVVLSDEQRAENLKQLLAVKAQLKLVKP